jgi:hypothetical protein
MRANQDDGRENGHQVKRQLKYNSPHVDPACASRSAVTAERRPDACQNCCRDAGADVISVTGVGARL